MSSLKRTLNASEAVDVLNRAVGRLVDQPECDEAAAVQANLPLCEETLAARCAALPRLLETIQELGKLLDW